MLGALKLFNGLCPHYPVSVFLPCLLRVPPNGGTNRFIWDRNYSIFRQWVHHQLTKEGRANLGWNWGRGREKTPIRQCQITQQACLSFVSTMVLLPVSICFLSGWWLMGSVQEYHVKVSRRWFLCQRCQHPLPSMNRSRWLPKNTNLIETLHETGWFHLHISDIKRQRIKLRNSLLLVNEGKEASSREMKMT